MSKYSKYYEEWIEKYKSGMSLRDISIEYRCSESGVNSVIKKRGLIRCGADYSDYYEEWARKYNGGMSCIKISKEYECHPDTVWKVIRKLVTTRTNSESHLINYNYSKYYDEWANLYLEGKSSKDIAGIYHCGVNTVYRVMAKIDIVRDYGESRVLRTLLKYADNDMYFDDLNSEGPAYFLGLIVSDGCIMSRGGGRQQVLGLALHEKDGYMVENLAKILGRNVYRMHPKGGSGDGIGVRIGSNYLVNRLRYYNITERKSTDGHIETPLKYVPNDMRHHYIRGIIDGDGCIYCNRTYSLSVCGNYYDMLDVANIFSTIGCRKLLPRNEGNDLYEVSWGSIGDINKIINYIYADATIYLVRKKQKANEILRIYESKKLKSNK